MALSLTSISYDYKDEKDNVLASIEYDSEADTVKIVKGDNVETLTFPTKHIDTVRSLLKEVKTRLGELE